MTSVVRPLLPHIHGIGYVQYVGHDVGIGTQDPGLTSCCLAVLHAWSIPTSQPTYLKSNAVLSNLMTACILMRCFKYYYREYQGDTRLFLIKLQLGFNIQIRKSKDTEFYFFV